MKKLGLLVLIVGFINFLGGILGQSQEDKLEEDSQNFLNFMESNDLLGGVYYMNNSIEESIEERDTLRLALSYNQLGLIYHCSGNDGKASDYYLKALETISRIEGMDSVGHYDYMYYNFLHSSLLSHNFYEFDSVFPIALDVARKNQSTHFYADYKLLLDRYYEQGDFRKIQELAPRLLEKLKDGGPPEWSDFFKEVHRNSLDDFLYELNFFYALSLIKSDDSAETNKGYDMLIKIDADHLTCCGKDENLNINSKLSLLNYYKAKYYKRKGEFHAAIKHFELSDTYRLNTVNTLKKEIARRGKIISKVSDWESKIRHLRELDEKNQVLSKYYNLVLILGLLIISFLVFYTWKTHQTNKKIRAFNTKLKQANQELIQADEDRYKFFALLSHELRTPVYGLSGLVSSLKEETKLSEEGKNYMESLGITATYMSMLVNNILQVSRFRFEEVLPKPGQHLLLEMLHNLNKTFKPIILDKGLQIVNEIDKRLGNPYLVFDWIMLEQIFINLLQNAVKYSREGQPIFLRAIMMDQSKKDSIRIRFEVEDQGKGIDDKLKAKIFEAFKNPGQLDFKQGVGIGLYVVSELLSRFGTTIDFTSTTGVGSKFYFEINFTKATPPAIKSTHTDQITDTGKFLKHLKILAVDDSELNLLITQKQVSKIGNTSCDVASSGYKALEMVQKEHYDLILMDINMPEMNGYETTTRIKSILPEMPVIALTALHFDEVFNRAASVGIEHIITKPFEFDFFRETIWKGVYSVKNSSRPISLSSKKTG